MPFSRQIRSNSTSPVPGPNRPVNTLPLSVKICSGTPWRAHRLRQRVAHRPRRRPRHHHAPRSQNREWSSIPDTIFASRPVGEPHPADDVHLPQLHRPGPLPPLVIRPLAPPRLGLDQPVTHQTPIDRRPPRQRHDTLPAPADDRSCADPTPDAPGAAPRSAPRPPAASDADTTTASPTHPPAPPDPAPRTGAATDAPSGALTPNRRATSVTVAPSFSTSSTA